MSDNLQKYQASEAATIRCSVKKGVLRNFAKFAGKHLCQSLFFNKVAGLRLWHRCFPVNFAKFLRTPFLQNTLWRLLFRFEQALMIVKSLSRKNTHTHTHESHKIVASLERSFYRSSHSKMLLKIGVFKNFTNFKRKHLWWSLFLIRLRPFNIFFTEHLRRLLLILLNYITMNI